MIRTTNKEENVHNSCIFAVYAINMAIVVVNGHIFRLSTTEYENEEAILNSFSFIETSRKRIKNALTQKGKPANADTYCYRNRLYGIAIDAPPDCRS